jgi:predicted ATPase
MVSKPIHNTSTLPTRFVGREREIAEIAAHLSDPACRLLTLIGVGGVGKTSLAIMAAAQVRHTFVHEVWFVPLQQASTPDVLVMAVAAVLQAPFAATADPTAQLARFLAERTILLILDNFEQLLHTGGADFLSSLLLMAPGLKLLVTSREALNLREEWRYSVGGLPISGRSLTRRIAPILESTSRPRSNLAPFLHWR